MKSQTMIPVVCVQGRTIPEVWEKAVIRVWEEGMSIKTEYDREGDPPSRDATVIMAIGDPFGEPRIHRAFPGGFDDLEVYTQEVVDGIHDHWIKPEEGKWTYTYHHRLFSYEAGDRLVDQIDSVVRRLASSPCTRRAQAITWRPDVDPPSDDPPCLQRIWCRLVGHGDGYRLAMNTHWRSRDMYKAAFMNIFALTELQRVMAAKIASQGGFPVEPGSYIDMIDSGHIYGSYYSDFEGFLKTVRERSFEERTWTMEFAAPMLEEARRKLAGEKPS